jgi:dipeptide transport system ATP-binding protein
VTTRAPFDLPPSGTLLRVRDLEVRFRTRKQTVHAVNGISFDLQPGDTLGIVGESGSGKSVSALAMLGILPKAGQVTGGEVLFDDTDLLQLPDSALRRIRGRDIAMVFQDPMTSLNPVLRVGRQITEALTTHLDMDKDAAREEAIALLDRVGIPDARRRVDDYPHQFSGGMRQRVMIAMAISCKPRILIADEPTTALDVTIQAQILDLLVGLQRETGMALVLITHDMGVVAETAQRVAVQYAGQKVEEQPVDTLFSDPHHPYTASLLAALPERAIGRRLPSIPGVVPGQFDRPSGCLFSPRCRFATSRCVEKVPPVQGRAAGFALCHYPLIQGRPVGHPDPDASMATRVTA